MVKNNFKKLIAIPISAFILVLFICFFYFPQNSLVVNIGGGIGNQFFRYSAAYNFAKQKNLKLYLIVNKKKYYADNKTSADRNFELKNFDKIKNDVVTKNFFLKMIELYYNLVVDYDFILKYSPIGLVNENNYYEILKSDKKRRFYILDGHFESEIFFDDSKDDIKKIFDTDIFVNKIHQDLIGDISTKDSVCMHIRRGDFRKDDLLSEDYYIKAIDFTKKFVTNNPKFFIFSDDINEAKNFISDFIQNDYHKYVSHPKYGPTDDLILMSKCSNNIIANSTFSWWAAYLNKNNGKVIAPMPRYRIEQINKIKSFHSRYSSKKNINFSYPSDWYGIYYNEKNIKQLYSGLFKRKDVDKIFSDYNENQTYILNHNVRKKICETNLESEIGNYQKKYDLCEYVDKPTVVTAYYDIKSKATKETYMKWASNFLKIPFNLVVFTDKQNVEWIKKLRGDLPIYFIVKDIEDLYHYKYLNEYQAEQKKDNNKKHSYELYTIWAEKVKFVNRAIDVNYYNSKSFIWMDIGCVREEKYLYLDFPKISLMNENMMNFYSVKEFSYNNIQKSLANNNDITISGGLQYGDILSWKIYEKLWDKEFDKMHKNGEIITNDQTIISNIFLKNYNFINLIYPPVKYTGDRWWYGITHLSGSEEIFE